MKLPSQEEQEGIKDGNEHKRINCTYKYLI